MLVHIDSFKFKIKPTKSEIGGIKKRFTKSASIKDITVKQLASALTSGKTVQPGVTPFSEESKNKGNKGTSKEDFLQQTVFMNDIDNKREENTKETPAIVVEMLEKYNLKPAFLYETFHSTAENIRFRYALVSDEAFTDKEERDRVQTALVSISGQSDTDCINADRMFFGTDKGLIDEFTDFNAVCKKSDLLALADVYAHITSENEEKADKLKFGTIIPIGQRHGTLVSFASTVLKKYGVCEKAYEVFMQRASQCEELIPDDEIYRIWADACNYYEKKICQNPTYVAPNDYNAQDFKDNLIPTDFTDVGQATLFANLYGDRLKYTPATKWLVYDGKAWRENELTAQGLVQELTVRQLQLSRELLRTAQEAESDAAEQENDDVVEKAKEDIQFAKKYRTFVLGERKSNRISATLTEARPQLQLDVSELDKDPFILNTPAGTVDLKTGIIRSHNPGDYCTKITAVSPGMKGKDEFEAFLRMVTCGDKELEEYHQIVAGMKAVGKVFCENMEIDIGRGGNGKSTLNNAMGYVLGDYTGNLSAETFTVNCRKNKSPEYAELRGKRLVIAAELEEGMRLDTSIVKKLCSTDPIIAEKKFKDPITFIPSHTVVLYTNHLPKVGTTDKGTWDRLVVVPFNANLRGMKGEIKNYADHLFRNCGEYILTWIIEGAKKFIANDYMVTPPECVRKAIEEYQKTNDWLNNFLEECCETDSMYTQKSGELYQEYRNYAVRNGDYTRSAADFKAAIESAGYSYKKTKTGAFVYGLRVQDDYAPAQPLTGDFLKR